MNDLPLCSEAGRLVACEEIALDVVFAEVHDSGSLSVMRTTIDFFHLAYPCALSMFVQRIQTNGQSQKQARLNLPNAYLHA